MGVGAFAEPPKDCPDYRRGYLCGMIRGDGSLRDDAYERVGGWDGRIFSFRLALVDQEPLDRTRDYLARVGIRTAEFTFSEATAARRRMMAIRSHGRDQVRFIEWLIRWPNSPSTDWQKGFLAGIFDAEGSYSGSLRIANADRAIVGWTIASMAALGFGVAAEDRDRPNGLTYVRLRGGLKEVLRFFHTTDPAITRTRTIDGTAIKSNARLKVTSIEPLGLDLPMFDITTGTGDFIANGVVSHNCFARKSHTYLDLDSGHDFDSKIVVKVNAPDLVRRELAAPRWRGEHIAMGTNVDCYQRAEGRYRLMPGILAALRDTANPFSILTKGTLILRDLDLPCCGGSWSRGRPARSAGWRCAPRSPRQACPARCSWGRSCRSCPTPRRSWRPPCGRSRRPGPPRSRRSCCTCAAARGSGSSAGWARPTRAWCPATVPSTAAARTPRRPTRSG